LTTLLTTLMNHDELDLRRTRSDDDHLTLPSAAHFQEFSDA
jgi:hypothetical protein